MAMPGAVLITPAVLGLVEGFVQVKALGAMPVRGLRDSVEVYEVTGAGMVRSRLQAAAARGLTRFVGRQPELETLQQALVQARAGHGQVVAMVGEAGVGKSRLLYEFAHSHYTQGWLVLESASVSYGKATPYFPVIDLLKRYCHVEERDDPRTIRAKVTGQLLTLDETLHETLPALLARRQGELPRAIPALERSLALCQSANFPRLFPVVAAILGMAYALAGRAPEAVPLLDQMLEHLATGSRVILPRARAHRAERGAAPRGPRGRGGCACRTPPRPLPHPPRARLPGACLPAPRRGRHASRAPGRRPGRRPLPSGPRPG